MPENRKEEREMRGGYRENSGRKPAERKTAVIGVRIPIELAEKFRANNDLKKEVKNAVLEILSR